MNEQVVCMYVRTYIRTERSTFCVFKTPDIRVYYTITHINDHNGIDNRVAPLFRNVTSYRKLITTGDTLRFSPTDRKVETSKSEKTRDTTAITRHNVIPEIVLTLLSPT